MAAFDPQVQRTHPLDYRLMQNSFVTMFRDAAVLAEAEDWLRAHAYKVIEVDAVGWAHEDQMHNDLAHVLGFPDYYGRNLNALNDCLSEIASGDQPLIATSTGLVLVMLRYDNFVRAQPDVAHDVLDVYAVQARSAALFGHRMLCLVQSDDPRLVLPPVGATTVDWNPQEWLDSSRGL